MIGECWRVGGGGAAAAGGVCRVPVVIRVGTLQKVVDNTLMETTLLEASWAVERRIERRKKKYKVGENEILS